MSVLVRLLVLILVMSAVVFGAKGDARYAVLPEQYKLNQMLKVNENVHLGTPGQNLSSTVPVLPLAVNTMFLRHKFAGNSYGWYSGNVAGDKFEKLYAFDLVANKLSAYEAIHLRYYASRRAKPFQDENDIYFDKHYLYTSRVRELFFMQNGEWQELKSVSLPGIVKIEAPPEGAVAIIGSAVLGKIPVTLYPVPPGIFFATFVIPQNLPVTVGTFVRSGKVATLKPIIVSWDTTRFKVQSAVNAELVMNTRTLEETERLYDQFIADIANSPITEGVVPFDSIYPVMKNPPLGVKQDDSSYQAYVLEYQNTRARAKAQWKDQKCSDLVAFNRLLMSRIETFEKDTVRNILTPVSVTLLPAEKVMSFKFEGVEKRNDVIWMGAPRDKNIFDSIASAIQDTSKVQIGVTFQNKPVWIRDKDVVVSRRHYRYLKLDFVFNGKTYEGEGKFILPDYVLRLAEVQLWLNPPPLLPPQVIPLQDTLKKAMPDTIPVIDPLIDFFRGAVVEVDSGSFRYRGKIVTLSPYAIHKTEVTQDHYRRIIGNDSATFKGQNIPVHNVTWDQANKFCKTIGGFLPTEAQWEYAGRAANNEGSLWNLDENPDPLAYAVFKKNSQALGKKDTLYGPRAVASRKPNEWGIYDMSGNLAEWTFDQYSAFSFYVETSNPTGSLLGYRRVIKGGSWKSDEDEIDLTGVEAEDPRFWSDDLGFRCAFPSHQKVDLGKAAKILKDRGVTIPVAVPKIQEK